jgi:dihydroorotate dehydrogenase (NAD+) catalytic subunit
MVNAVGLQGEGVEHWMQHDLPALRARGARVIASIWGHTVADYAKAAELLVQVADDLVALEVNLSCPNLDHGATMFASDPQDTSSAIRAVCEARVAIPVFAKLSPAGADLTRVAAAALEAGATGLTLINTVRALLVDADARRPVLGGPGGGLSGAAIKPIALRAVHDVTQAHPGVPVIGTGGVTNGVDAVEMLLAGATAVGVGTATFADPRACLRVRDELVRWCAARGVRSVAELTGGLRWETE